MKEEFEKLREEVAALRREIAMLRRQRSPVAPNPPLHPAFYPSMGIAPAQSWGGTPAYPGAPWPITSSGAAISSTLDAMPYNGAEQEFGG